MAVNIVYRFILITFVILFGCADQKPLTIEARGTLHGLMMQGDVDTKVKLDTLLTKPHMYGLGAAKSLDGEILVWDSQLFVSRIRDSAIITSNSNDAEAALLVYANIAEWEPFEIGLVLSVQGLEDAISKLLTKTNHLEPTAFLIHATVSELSGHIVTKESIGSKDHHSSGYTIDLKNQAIDLLGFYSTKHEGVFTHRGSKSHIHFKISGPDQVGHLDEISFSKPVKILLPK